MEAEMEALQWPMCSVCELRPSMNCKFCRALAPVNPVTRTFRKEVSLIENIDLAKGWTKLTVLKGLPTSRHICVTNPELRTPEGVVLRGATEVVCKDAVAPHTDLLVRVRDDRRREIALEAGEVVAVRGWSSGGAPGARWMARTCPPDCPDLARWLADSGLKQQPWCGVRVTMRLNVHLMYSVDAHRYVLVDPERWTGPGRWDNVRPEPMTECDLLARELTEVAFHRAVRAAASTAIQCAWRRCISDPAYATCRRRLMREFAELA